MNNLRIIFLVLIVSSCTAQHHVPDLKTEESGNSLLWEVSGKDLKSPSYLFGTFHLFCRNDIKFSEPLKKALAASTNVYFELDLDDPSMLLGGLAMMNMKNGVKLKDLYSEADYNKIATYFKDSLGTPLNMFQNMKPYMLVAMLYPKMMPCKQISGVEQELMKMAKDQKKEILGLETMAFQASVFDSIPYQQQAQELLKSIDSIAHFRQYFDSMVTVYKSQQLNKIEGLFNDNEMGMAEHQDVLLDNRNKNWVQQLKTIMKKDPVFIAVGAGHLPGDKGVISLLKKEGYTVRPVKNN